MVQMITRPSAPTTISRRPGLELPGAGRGRGVYPRRLGRVLARIRHLLAGRRRCRDYAARAGHGKPAGGPVVHLHGRDHLDDRHRRRVPRPGPGPDPCRARGCGRYRRAGADHWIPGWQQAAGWVFVAAAALAIYQGTALMINGVLGVTVLPLFTWRRDENIPGGYPVQPIQLAEGEPGVKAGQ
jgi:hypothetical protein